MTLSDDTALPELYGSGDYVGIRGTWNRSQFNGYKVNYVPFIDGRPSGIAQDVVTGFLDGDKARGRPVGLGVDGTGALLLPTMLRIRFGVWPMRMARRYPSRCRQMSSQRRRS